jgi:hypothetical protein
MSETPTGQYKELTRDEGWELLERQAQQHLAVTASEFIEHWDAGDYRTGPKREEAAYVALFLAYVR